MSDHPETAPWGTLPGDKADPNYGRECIRCRGAIRAGLRHAHVCPQHPETVSLRLAEAAAPGPWEADCSPGGRPAILAPVDDEVTQTLARVESAADASHIAHAHPGRVAAYARCVARLRLIVAAGHMSWCKGKGVFGDGDDCTCGHDLDLAALGAVDAEG